ncbi:cell division protein FtsZ (plasmid) [Paenibacillus larvae subsp. larvae]|uniref:Cell division protein FtsZ n=1 Tax=Paenibacillus larvae subsp. larvae TaxID=147375 RepID=A0A2L1U7R3_9BACL|nr:hypothetical protein [Paenibacillus larvae]AQT86989.1 hypothetical protein B1222_23435 [Paenibacillus larvae subsp. pulvifaciens]AQZ49321.1 hypothetical protein B5S25_22740 [Paenibacillus larvae subsp. pulvifaciens]AVF28977.1 cell division protein FtsZ [Paenibacillus larvae subsp. larvae]AVF33358.1 cell division protein FtsZ [Paenibacillus larvae subsp. larvae]MBH0344827.1 hypothetical protein [Paenibacillus larvae]
MPIKPSFKDMNLGAMKAALAPFALGEEAEKGLKKLLNIDIVTLGQGGGRIGAELARFGWNTWMVNSAEVDMAEHDWIKNKIMLRDPDRGNLQGTGKNAAIGHAIAQKNVNEFKKIAIETQYSDLVVVTVALGGGQGNGAIPTAIEWISKARDLAEKRTEKGNPTIMVIASLPARDESNPNVWLNAASGIKKIQEYINEKKIGACCLIDNELIRDYYERQEKLIYMNRVFSALDYSNIIMARSLFETFILTVLSGQASMDSTEALEILSTPGWLTINRKEIVHTKDLDLNYEINSLFTENEVLASLDVSNSIAGGIAVITSAHNQLAAELVDQVKPIANKILGRPSVLHSAILQTNSINKKTFLIGFAVTPSLPDTITGSLIGKYREEKQRKEEREAAARQASAAFEDIEDIYTKPKAQSKNPITLDELDGKEEPKQKRAITFDDL